MSIPLYQSSPAGTGGGGGAVSSVFGRTGAVVATSGDYSFSLISGSVAASQLPNPSSTTLGGIQSIAGVSHQWISSISTLGVPVLTQPAFSDISGSVAAAQLPNPSATTLGGVQSASAVANQWVNSISTAGVPVLSQPAFSNLSGSISAGQIATGTVTWDTLGNAAAALTLSNAGNATTFNQTSGVTWSWANTTIATVSSTNLSPIHQLSANYWTGAASAADTWTVQSSLAAGSNAASTLTFAHAGSTGSPIVVFPGLTVSAGTVSPTLAISNANTGALDFVRFSQAANLVAGIGYDSTNLLLFFGPYSNANYFSTVIGGQSNSATTSTRSAVVLGYRGTFTATSGAQQGVSIGDNATGALRPLNFAPTSGTATFVGLVVSPTINQTGGANGNYTALRVNAIETAIGGSSNLLLDLQAGTSGGVSRFSVDNSGQPLQSTANGATWKYGQASELLTLSTVAITTDTVGNLLPANSIIEAVVCRVTTAITLSASWSCGDATTAARFSTGNAIAVNTTAVGLTHANVALPSAAGPVQTAAAKVRITAATSNPGAGVVRITVFYRQFVAPTS